MPSLPSSPSTTRAAVAQTPRPLVLPFENGIVAVETRVTSPVIVGAADHNEPLQTNHPSGCRPVKTTIERIVDGIERIV